MRDAHTFFLGTGQRQSSRWQSSAAATLITATLFTAAFASMSRLGVPVESSHVVDETPSLVFFPPKLAVEAPHKTIERARPTVVTPTPAPSAPRAQTVAPTAPVVVPAPPPPAPRVKADSAAAGASNEAISALTRLVPMRDVPTFPRSSSPTVARGAPIAPSGVTTSSAPLTTAQRDSIVTNRVAEAVAEARTEAAGNSGVHGVGGTQRGTLSAGVSIPFPLFSSGPSAAERKRNAVIDADNQLRLRRLQDMAIAHRDSIRTDSLRRDSLARRAIRP